MGNGKPHTLTHAFILKQAPALCSSLVVLVEFGGVSRHFGSSPNDLLWSCKFADGLSIIRELLYDLF